MKRPIIGLMPLYDPEKDSYWMLPGYLQGVEEAGGIPVILPPRAEAEDLDSLLDLLDGVLLTGGQDVDPKLYGQAPAEELGPLCPERDRLELRLLRRALIMDLPILGICRGIQLVNVALDGTLWQDLPTERPSGVAHRFNDPDTPIAHRVRLVPGTPIAELLKTDELGVNSHHHQAIRTLAPALREMARSEDGLIEAVYHPDKRFLWAVQWHPEMSLDSSSSRAIFAAFVSACRGEAAFAPGSDTAPLGFWGSDKGRCPALTSLPGIRTPRDLYRALLRCWSEETCASSMRHCWSEDNPTLGQCSITAFIVQDIFGGQVRGVVLENGFVHCYNAVGDCVFDLTSEQFGGEIPRYGDDPEQRREDHFARQPEKLTRYKALWAALRRYLDL